MAANAYSSTRSKPRTVISEFSWSSRLNSDWKFLTHLYRWVARGPTMARRQNFDRIGVESTIDLREKYF